MRAVSAILALASAAAVPDPATLAASVISAYMRQPFTSPFWTYAYGPGSLASATFEAAKQFKTPGVVRGLDRRLDSWLSNTSSVAYAVLNHVPLPYPGPEDGEGGGGGWCAAGGSGFAR